MNRPPLSQPNRPPNDDPARQGSNPNRQANGASLLTDVHLTSSRKTRASLLPRSSESPTTSGATTLIRTSSEICWKYCSTRVKESNCRMWSWRPAQTRRPTCSWQFPRSAWTRRATKSSICSWSKRRILDWVWRSSVLKKARLCSRAKISTSSGIGSSK